MDFYLAIRSGQGLGQVLFSDGKFNGIHHICINSLVPSVKKIHSISITKTQYTAIFHAVKMKIFR